LSGGEGSESHGCIYDPRLGRFLSPDPYVQDPTYSQSLNRYSYVWNNPLRYTDPTGYRTWWDNFKAWGKKHKNEIISTVVSITVAVVVTALTGGIGSPLTVMLGGMAGGFTGGMVGARLNGDSWSDAWDAALQGMVIGGISALVSFSVGSVISSSFASIGNATLQTIAREGTRALAHGLTQGYLSLVQGGSFWSGFASGAFSSLGGSLLQGFNLTDRLGTVGSVGVGALMGGIAAELSGGDFGVGAISGAWVTLFNHLAHWGEKTVKQQQERSTLNKVELTTEATSLSNEVKKELIEIAAKNDPSVKELKYFKGIKALGKVLIAGQAVITGVEAYNDYTKGNYYSMGARVAVLTVAAAAATVPFVGWAIAGGIGLADALWGERLYNQIQLKYGK